MSAAGTLKKTERERIRRTVEERRVAEDVSISKLAAILGVPRTTLSKVLGGDYPGTEGKRDTVLRLARTWAQRGEDRFETPDAAYVPTTIGEQILTVCDIALEQPCMGIVKTPSGVGKTTALREMAKRLGEGHCVYLQAGAAMNLKRELLFELVEKLAITPKPKSTMSTLYRQVRKRMAGHYAGGKGGSFLILIDEATTLHPNALNMLRNLHDDPACRTAVVLADTIARMDGFLYSRRGIPGGNEQLRSRSKAQFIWPVSKAIPKNDVRRVAATTLVGLGYSRKLDARALDYLVRLAQKPGALRNVASRIQTVAYVAGKRNVQADFSVSQLDFVASLSGDEPQMRHANIPFGRPDESVPPPNEAAMRKAV